MSNGPQRDLAIETSSRSGSVALAEGGTVVCAQALAGHRRHAGELLPTVHNLLMAQGWPVESLAEVHLSIGPGSFTGLRVAVAVARTLSWSLGLRIVAVPTVDVLARNALVLPSPPAHLAVLLDAKRGQCFAAAFQFEGDDYRKRIDAHLCTPAEFLADLPRPLAVLGEGVTYHAEAVSASGAEVLPMDLAIPRAEQVHAVGYRLARSGQYTPSGDLLPLYIRRPEAEEKWEQLHGPAGIRRRY